MKARYLVLAAGLAIGWAGGAQAAQTATKDNFVRAETDQYFSDFVKAGAFGKFTHDRALADVNC